MAIGVFDSGIGGLTVFKAISNNFPMLDMFYFGDTARVPYGNKSPETIVKYTLECAKFLAQNHKLSCLVVACNTASSHALETLHSELSIPILGVIKPGAKNACDITKTNKISVLATHATVNSLSYVRTINEINSNINVIQNACPLFVPLVEEALIDGDMVKMVVKESLKSIMKTDVDTIILGCTHYPLLEPIIQKLMPAVNIIDSTKYIIDDLKVLNINLIEKGERKIYITDLSHAFHSLKNMLVGDISIKVVKV